MHPTPAGPTITTVRTPGAALHVEARGQGPIVMLVGCPMDADAFAPLADVLAASFTVVTMDPRGIRRSHVDDRSLDVTPEVLAEDLSHVLQSLNAGRASVFGSSGGAVAALAFALAHPEQVHTVIAHEPPLEELLDDRDHLRANTEAMVQAHLAGDVDEAWRLFFEGADIDMADEPGSVPAPGSGPDVEPRDPQSIVDEAFFFAHTLRPSTWWQPDLMALRASPVRILVGIGEGSTGQVCDRASRALAEALGTATTTFPGDHVGFVEHPDAFARLLRTVLDTDTP